MTLTAVDPATGEPLTALTDATERAVRRYIGDGTWVWGRRASAGSVAALEAATVAGWAAVHAPAAPPRPVFEFA